MAKHPYDYMINPPSEAEQVFEETIDELSKRSDNYIESKRYLEDNLNPLNDVTSFYDDYSLLYETNFEGFSPVDKYFERNS